MSETHLDSCHHSMVDDSASEVKLRWLFVPGVVRHVWRTVARHLTVFHGTVGLAESSKTAPVVLAHLATVP